MCRRRCHHNEAQAGDHRRRTGNVRHLGEAAQVRRTNCDFVAARCCACGVLFWWLARRWSHGWPYTRARRQTNKPRKEKTEGGCIVTVDKFLIYSTECSQCLSHLNERALNDGKFAINFALLVSTLPLKSFAVDGLSMRSAMLIVLQANFESNVVFIFLLLIFLFSSWEQGESWN